MHVSSKARTECAASIEFHLERKEAISSALILRTKCSYIHGFISSPKIEEPIDSLGDARVFQALDTNYGYWQVEEEGRD